MTIRRTIPQEHRPREQMRALLIELFQNAQTPLSRTDIARALNRRKSLNVNSLIDQLVEEGLCERSIKTYPNGVQGYVYWWKR